MRVIKVKDYEEMSRAAADFIGAEVLLNPQSVLGLATGGTPVGAYKLLAERCKEKRLDFSGVRTVNLDEYIGLPPEHDQSYRYFMNTQLFDHINILKENTHVPNGVALKTDEECARYDALIESLGGIDLQLLGIGANGHIGFNEPGDSFVTATNVVSLTESTRDANKRFFSSIDEVPSYAITTGMRGIFTSKRVLMLASGEGKAWAVHGLINGPVTPHNPASLMALHPDFTLIADEAALDYKE